MTNRSWPVIEIMAIVIIWTYVFRHLYMGLVMIDEKGRAVNCPPPSCLALFSGQLQEMSEHQKV